MTGKNTDGAAVPSAKAGPRFGRFSYDVSTNRLNWSDRTFQIFGLDSAQVLPTLAVMSSHQHPDDRQSWDDNVRRALTDGATFCQWHRIVDGKRRVRSALSIGYPAGSVSGGVTGLNGFVVDLTTTLRRNREQETTRAVLDSAATRDLIEQAKGMLMVIFDLDETQAFDLLRWHSSYNNIKVREVAATLVDRLVDAELAGLPPRQRLTAILANLKRGKTAGASAGTPPEPVADTPAEPPQEEGPSPSSIKRISNADLPRTMMRAVSVAAQSISIADWLDPEQPLVYVNEAFSDLTGYPADEILGRNCRFLQGPDRDPVAVADLRLALARGREIRTLIRNFRKDGSGFWNEVHLSPVRDDAGRITHYIGYQSDVSERVEREQTLRRLAHHDARTGLPNDAAALADLEATITSAARSGSGFSVLYAAFTDEPTGDGSRALPVKTIDRIRQGLPADATVSALGDDALLIRLATGDAGSGTDAVAAVWATVSDAVAAHKGGSQIGVRIGLAHYPQDAPDAENLVRLARADSRRHLESR